MLGRLANGGSEEERAISFQSIWGAGDSMAWANEAGTNVTADSSFAIAPFYAAVNLISTTIATLPVPRSEAHAFGCVHVDETGRIIGLS